jgi:hypothetical protein
MVAKLAAVTAAVGSGIGCGRTGGKLQVDSPALPYQKPDISEITGIDEDDDSGSGSSTQAPAK